MLKTIESARRELRELDEQLERLGHTLTAARAENVELVGAREVLDMTGLARSALMQRIKRGTVPEPIAHLECGRIWRKQDIIEWWQAK